MSQKTSLKNLDINNIGAWPQNAKVGFCVVLAIFILALSYFLFVRGKTQTLESLEQEEVRLRQDFEKEQAKAANLEPLKQQLAQMEQVLQQMLRQLPSKTEMPDLIIDISQTALSSGLTNELFQPQPETLKEFYAEKPIQLRMVGNYHQFGAFVSGVASLPRVVILTMHDISLQPKEGKGGVNRGALELSGTVKTYRYLDETEVAEQEAAAAEASKGAGKSQAGSAGETPLTRRNWAWIVPVVLVISGCARASPARPATPRISRSGWRTCVHVPRLRLSRCR